MRMDAKLDAKFYGEIRKAKDNSIVPDDEYMVFLAKDNAFPATLQFYLEKCVELKCDQEHIDAIKRTIARLKVWRERYPDRLKVPDAKGETLLG
jgi:hypothetical protein